MWELAIVIGIIGLTFLLIYLSQFLQETHPEISYLLLLVSFVFFPVSFIILKFIAEPNNTAIDNILVKLYVASMWIMIFELFWVMIMFIVMIIKFFQKKGQELRG